MNLNTDPFLKIMKNKIRKELHAFIHVTSVIQGGGSSHGLLKDEGKSAGKGPLSWPETQENM